MNYSQKIVQLYQKEFFLQGGSSPFRGGFLSPSLNLAEGMSPPDGRAHLQHAVFGLIALIFIPKAIKSLTFYFKYIILWHMYTVRAKEDSIGRFIVSARQTPPHHQDPTLEVHS